MSESARSLERPVLLPVPDGATDEDMSRIREALGNEEVNNGVQWLVTDGLIDTGLAEDYLEHFKDVLNKEHGLDPEYAPFVISACKRNFEIKDRMYGQA